jgi:hypothetical protein
MAEVILDYVSRDLYRRRKALDLLHEKARQGSLGAKTGQGFCY